MTDLLSILPEISTVSFSHILPSLERNSITSTDLLSLESVDIAKRAQIPAREVRRLTETILQNLQQQFQSQPDQNEEKIDCLRSAGTELIAQWQSIRCLEDQRGPSETSFAIPTGYVTEVTGESGSGKTQFLLSLLLAVQLSPPNGLGRPALYISTEAPLQTARLDQILNSHPYLQSLSITDRPSMSKVLSIQIQDVESQEHILRYQLPVAVRRHNVGLVIIDSITANYRAEFDHRPGQKGDNAMSKRSAQLLELGCLLRELSRTENLAIVVANQVADRFRSQTSDQSDPIPSGNSTNSANSKANDLEFNEHSSELNQETLSLEHQQNWFTGWGDRLKSLHAPNQKTPSLGLIWTNQLDARIALTKSSWSSSSRLNEGHKFGRKSKRHRRIVFASWAKDSTGLPGREFSIEQSGMDLTA